MRTIDSDEVRKNLNYPSATPSKQRRKNSTPFRRRRASSTKSVLFSSLSLLVLALFTAQQLRSGKRVLDNKRITLALKSLDVLNLPEEGTSSSSNRQTTKTAVDDPSASAKTLALLYPPGLLGGYRNQVMRFIALVTYANTNNMTQMLLNSLLWSTQLGGIGGHHKWFPIPFDWVFDVDHWNTFAPEHLPLLVRDDQMAFDNTKNVNGSCWSRAYEMEGYEQLLHGERIDGSLNTSTHRYAYANKQQNSTINHLQRAALLQGTLTPLMHNVTVPFITGHFEFNPRREDYRSAVDHCTEPYTYGGGTQAGRLWNDYLRFHRGTDARDRSTSAVPFETDVWVHRALRPAQPWRDLAEQCVARHAQTGRYMALHARVELEIMGHSCGSSMEKNLTAILERVYKLHDEQPQQPLSGLFIAVSRAGMEETGTGTYEKFKLYADENLRALNVLTGHNGFSSSKAESPQLFHEIRERLPVFECGERILKDYYAAHADVPDHGALLQSVLNFHVAVSADVFVGVKGSSYSTDVLTTRYWLGKGDANYRYTKTGIDRVQGLPEPHGKCGRN